MVEEIRIVQQDQEIVVLAQQVAQHHQQQLPIMKQDQMTVMVVLIKLKKW